MSSTRPQPRALTSSDASGRGKEPNNNERVARRTPKPPSTNITPRPPIKLPWNRLLPEYVYAAAQNLRRDAPVHEPIVRESPAAEELRPFLEAVKGDGTSALERLEVILPQYPFLIFHPYVSGTIRFLYALSTPVPEVIERAQEWIRRLWTAAGRGITFGYEVSIIPPRRSGGLSPMLVPYLNEMEGWAPSLRAIATRRVARELVRDYHDLFDHLGRCCQWKRLSGEQRANPSAFGLVLDEEKVVDNIIAAFSEFVRQHYGSTAVKMPTAADIRNLLIRGFDVPKGRSARQKVVCELLAMLPWTDAEAKPMSPPASLIDSTLETLRKSGLFKRPRE
jgi:hypothetical protein